MKNANPVRMLSYFAILVVVGGIIGGVWYVKGPLEQRRKADALKVAEEEAKPLEEKMKKYNVALKDLLNEFAKKTGKSEKTDKTDKTAKTDKTDKSYKAEQSDKTEPGPLSPEALKLKEEIKELDAKIAELDAQIVEIKKKHSK